MEREAFLLLEDGSVFRGVSFGAAREAVGEVVFNTSMTGYQEILTDPSYAGQIVVPTYPLIGNYGINERDIESARIQVRGFVVREWCPFPSHGDSRMTLDDYLRTAGVPGLSGVDTRALTRRLRRSGVMKGIIAVEGGVEEALARLKRGPDYGDTDFVREVSAKKPYEWDEGSRRAGAPRIVVLDEGLKYNILRILRRKGCAVTAVPATTSAEEVLALRPDGVVLSPGPGDPVLLEYVARTTRALVGRVPLFGICLGHQVLGIALGAKTFKLKFGHRGGNHPVKDVETGRVYITAQNHGYAVDASTLPPGLEVSLVNLNDGTVEGLRHRELPILTIQYHSEASPGPWDNEYLFDRFLAMVKETKR
ncbi:MAG: glutamine-hydrolyzing carbamoyl-phosphate synthase small subunit [Chloroflexi bacterium]|nr:glutamine-hydrolyzing carbamoyl-phosphate synthase small subunit [Chloroflexota bacterium]